MEASQQRIIDVMWCVWCCSPVVVVVVVVLLLCCC
jgi:hypothetical protein